jgi:predicted Fe-Mo cluster-binding NifX family protein
MKIAVTAAGNDLNSQVDPRFGRCQHLIIINTETNDIQVLENPNAGLSGGAGVQTAQLLADKKIDVVLTGNVGPNAIRTLNAAGIKVYTGIQGTVGDSVNMFKEGKLTEASQPTVDSHFGMGRGGRGRNNRF